VRTIQQVGPESYGAASNATDRSGALNLFESASIGDVLGTGTPDVVKYELSLSQAANLLLVGQNFPYNHLIGAFDGATGAPLPAWPTVTDDYQLLSANNIAKVDPTLPGNQVLAGTGLGQLHAYDGLTGHDALGFPKQTGGWLFSPAALAEDGHMADITREGWLFQWQTEAPACQPQWPSFRHDQQGSGNYDHDGTPPGPFLGASLKAAGGGRYTLSFTAPGDDGACGTPAAYIARAGSASVDAGAPAAGGSAVTREIELPAGARKLSLQARDEAGNLGPAATVKAR
jgi:hypothetical protein